MSLVLEWEIDPPVLCNGPRGLHVGSRNQRDSLVQYALAHRVPLAVVCCYTEPIDLPAEAAACGITQHHVELDDSEEEDITRLLADAARFIHDARDARRPVVVHCAMGVSRSVSVVVGYLMIHDGMSVEAAANHVRRARAVAAPNNGFIRQLAWLDCALRSGLWPAAAVAGNEESFEEEVQALVARLLDVFTDGNILSAGRVVRVDVTEYLNTLPGIESSGSGQRGSGMAGYLAAVGGPRNQMASPLPGDAPSDGDDDWEAALGNYDEMGNDIVASAAPLDVDAADVS
jgi:hypothetical protein